MRFNGLGGLFLGALGFVSAVLQPAHAAVVTKTFSGAVTSAVAGNPFNLQVGGILTGSLTFDAALLTGIGHELLVRPTVIPPAPNVFIDPSLKLDASIGGFSFQSEFDESFLFVRFFDGQIVDPDFLAFIPNPGTTSFRFSMAGSTLFGLGFGISSPFDNDGDGLDDILVAGVFDFDETPELPVPEPAGLAVFGAALAGLALARWRRKV